MTCKPKKFLSTAQDIKERELKKNENELRQMADDTQHGNPEGHGDFEREDLSPKSILYFLLVLAVGTVVCVVMIGGVYDFLDKREKASQPPVSPLVTNVPEDTRHVAPHYPQTAFPDPRLEEDERNQLNGIRRAEQEKLYSYGWVDQQAGTVRIPIERAMDLLIERGLPVRPQQEAAKGEGSEAATTSSE
jgi:hypothetical protein